MSAKPEKEAAPEKSGSTPAEAAAAPKAAGGVKAMVPAILAILVAPAASWGVAEFVLLPKLQAKLAAAAPAEGEEGHGEAAGPAPAAAKEKPAAHGKKKEGGHGKEGGGEGEDVHEYTNVVVNLSGTMGTRYLKTSFVVTGVKPGTVKAAFDADKARLTDVTLSVLSSLTLADLEEPGSKNILREKLVTAYNQAFGKRIAEQVYFSDFVVQ